MRLFLSLALAMGAFATMATADDHECALNFKAKTIDGESVDLEDYEGNVVLVVNTASQCGLTPQYAGLQELYKKYKDKGFVVLPKSANSYRIAQNGAVFDFELSDDDLDRLDALDENLVTGWDPTGAP